MARQRNAAKASRKSATSSSSYTAGGGGGGSLPAPFKRPPEVLQPLIETLDDRHVYITHVDSKPRAFKRNVFLVPVAMNLAVVALFAWRVYSMGPWYLDLLASSLGGQRNETTVVAAETEWDDLLPLVARRAAHFMLDLVLATFVWPWPVRFFWGVEEGGGSPWAWRWGVGFRDREVVVRRGRRDWTEKLGDDLLRSDEAQAALLARVGLATAPMLLHDKTGYVLMDADWDLDWVAMVDATTMVDRKMAAIEAFTTVVLVHQPEYGWLSVDMRQRSDPQSQGDERRRQILMFKEGLAAAGKEDLFYRWIEIIQYESTQPGGFSEEKQVKAAQQVRDLFEKEGVNFDEMWKQSVGTDAANGI